MHFISYIECGKFGETVQLSILQFQTFETTGPEIVNAIYLDLRSRKATYKLIDQYHWKHFDTKDDNHCLRGPGTYQYKTRNNTVNMFKSIFLKIKQDREIMIRSFLSHNHKQKHSYWEMQM